MKTKDSAGTWGSTSATILSLKALLRGLGGRKQTGTVRVTFAVNGERKELVIPPEQSDVMRILDFGPATRKGKNLVTIEVEGESSMMYQVVGRHYLPWDRVEAEPEKPLELEVRYDRTTLAQDDTLGARVRLAYQGKVPTFMIVLDLGIPPGFAVDPGSFAELLFDGSTPVRTAAGS